MTNLRKLSTILIILVMVFGIFLLAGEASVAMTADNQPGTNHYSASVAWLEVCSLVEMNSKTFSFPDKTYIPF